MCDYDDWNDAIGHWYFHEEAVGETVRLTVDAWALREAMKEFAEDDLFTSDDDAKDDFVGAIQTELRRRGDCWKWRIRPEAGYWLDFLGLIAIQVLAVYEMDDHPRGEYTKKAYWPRLADLLNIGLFGTLPRGLTYPDHQFLWRHGLNNWANNLQEGELGLIELPQDNEGHHHIRLPFSQALFRIADLERLGHFFTKAGFQANTNVSHRHMLNELQNFQSDSTLFGPHARRVLDDSDRLEPACDQVLRYFRQWDGKINSLKRIAERPKPRKIDISIGVTDRKPASLTIQFEDRVARETRQLSDKETADFLKGGQVNRLRFTKLQYRPRRRDLILAVYDPASGKYIGQTKARPGDSVLLLVPRNRQRDWLNSISAIAATERFDRFHSPDERVTNSWSSLGGLPQDWRLIRLQLRQTLTNPPAPWDKIIDAGTVPERVPTRPRPAGNPFPSPADPVDRRRGHGKDGRIPKDSPDFVGNPAGEPSVLPKTNLTNPEREMILQLLRRDSGVAFPDEIPSSDHPIIQMLRQANVTCTVPRE